MITREELTDQLWVHVGQDTRDEIMAFIADLETQLADARAEVKRLSKTDYEKATDKLNASLNFNQGSEK